MIIERLSLKNFRNYEELSIQLNPSVNYITGKNGQGKTNLVESIYCLGLTKSFRTNSDTDLTLKGESGFHILGEFKKENLVKHKVAVVFENKKKAISIDGKRLQRHSLIVGMIPVVLYHPDDHQLTAGAPGERRRWLDIVLSQGDHIYLNDLQRFRQVLKQKNALIEKIRIGENKKGDLEYWNHVFAQHVFSILTKRLAFIEEIREKAIETYQQISGKNEILFLKYATQLGSEIESPEKIEINLNKGQEAELKAGTSLLGPHRDDLTIFIDEKEVRKHASRGEHKSVLLALKLIEHTFLRLRAGTTPIFILDDIYSELDDSRQKNIVDEVCKLGQTFITSTEREFRSAKNEMNFFEVKNGKAENFGIH